MSQATLDTPPGAPNSGDHPAPAPSPAQPAPASGHVNYSRRPPQKASSFNWRLLLFIGVVAVPLLGIGWAALSSIMHQGIVWHGDYAEVDLKALGNFPFNARTGAVEDIPKRWRALDGKKVELKGFMYSPRNAGTRGTEFQFVYNVTKCCFNGPPLVQERVYAHTNGIEVPLYSQYDFVKISGTLHTRVERDETGAIHSVFDFDVQQVQQLE